MLRISALISALFIAVFGVAACGIESESRSFDPLQDHGVYQLKSFEFEGKKVDIDKV